MNVIIKGKGKEKLDKSDFIASGGQGSVYAKGGTAYKIYTDPATMIPEGKIIELAKMSDPCIIRPLDIILDSNTNPIGYTMRFLSNTYPLCQTFNKIFKQRNNVSPQQIIDLVQTFRTGVQHVHDQGILIVDCNEMNFLVSQGFDEVYFIDVDSYQTNNYPATVLMESVRDRHCNNKFSRETDWFSWGIVTFQMFIGIHPYKGKHASLKMDERMKQNISVFNKDVQVPHVCEPLDVIPQAYRDWYKAVFEDGKRVAPPTSLVAAIHIAAKVDRIVGSNKFDIQHIDDFAELGEITNVIYSFGTRLIQGKKGIHLASKYDFSVPSDAKIGFTPAMNHAVSAIIKNGTLVMNDLTRGLLLPCNISAEKVMSYDGRLYIKHGDRVSEIRFIEAGTTIKPTLHCVANVMERATSFYDGVVIQEMLGATYVSMFPKPGCHYQVRIKEIEPYRIVDAKFDRGVLMVVGIGRDGKYDRFVFRFNDDYSDHDVEIIDDITHTGLNFTVLDTGVCVHIDEEEDVNAFRSKMGTARITKVDDPIIKSDMRLYRWAGNAVVTKGKSLYGIKMKSSSK